MNRDLCGGNKRLLFYTENNLYHYPEHSELSVDLKMVSVLLLEEKNEKACGK